MGFEPIRILLRGILSPLCLPIPPLVHVLPSATEGYMKEHVMSERVKIACPDNQGILGGGLL